ncbi:beta-N-acetylhexosaminidase [Paenibacillaceae bacterium GAS479]|nr:beta-N-acetylhexosaminidase [Paenibacillaceae bacterium GAS479]
MEIAIQRNVAASILSKVHVVLFRGKIRLDDGRGNLIEFFTSIMMQYGNHFLLCHSLSLTITSRGEVLSMRSKRKLRARWSPATKVALAASFLLVTSLTILVSWNGRSIDPEALSAAVTAIAPAHAHKVTTVATGNEPPVSWPATPRLSLMQQTLVADQVLSMSTSDKVGQLIIAGLEGTSADASTRKIIKNQQAGGFILFRPNMKTVSGTVALLNELKDLNRQAGGKPLFLGTDEEGGRISRLPSPVIKLPSSGEIGLTESEAYAEAAGEQLANRVKAFGFNINFAPVLDVNSNPDNPVIGDRSFGNSPSLVARLGLAELKGHQRSGILGVVKHFPGHGDTSVDSHKQLPVLDHGLSRLSKIELPPFENAINNGAQAVMIAHISLPKLDPDYPASLSKPIITGLLREKMKFDGLVISDDLTMGAIKTNYDLGEAAVRFILAGGDIALVCHGDDNIIHVYNSLKQAVDNGTIPEKRLNESVYRILALKMVYKLTDPTSPVPAAEQLNKQMDAALAPYRAAAPESARKER